MVQRVHCQKREDMQVVYGLALPLLSQAQME